MSITIWENNGWEWRVQDPLVGISYGWAETLAEAVQEAQARAVAVAASRPPEGQP